MLNNIVPRFLNVSRFLSARSNHTLSSASTSLVQASPSIAGGSLWTIFFRTNIRNHFPRPKETKRIKVHGWEKRLSTPEGRRILMRRILKGRHVLSH